MSGYKRVLVTISESEYRRLHEVDMQNRFSSLPARQTVIEPARLDAIERMISMFAERQLSYQEYTYRMGAEVGEAENSSVRELLESTEASLQQFMDATNTSIQHLVQDKDDIQNQMLDREDGLHRLLSAREEDLYMHLSAREDAIQHSINHGLQLVRNDTDSLIQEFSADLDAQIDEIRQQQAGKLAAIQTHLLHMRDENIEKEDIARYWLESAMTLREFIDNEYDQERFLPGAFDAPDIQLRQAEENLAINMPEAALATAQQVYSEYSMKRLELEKMTTHWQATYIDALQQLDELFTYVLACRSVPAIETGGQELDIEIDLDRWSGEDYRALVRKCVPCVWACSHGLEN